MAKDPTDSPTDPQAQGPSVEMDTIPNIPTSPHLPGPRKAASGPPRAPDLPREVIECFDVITDLSSYMRGIGRKGNLDLLSKSPEIRLSRKRADPRLVTLTTPSSSLALKLRETAQRTVSSFTESKVSIVGVTSPHRGQGKSTIAVNLALLLARWRHGRVLLIDLHLRRPAVGKILGIPSPQGMSEVLQGEASIGSTLYRVSGRRLWVLPGGTATPSPASLMEKGLSRVMFFVRNSFDLVVIDSPSLTQFDVCPLIDYEADGWILALPPNSEPLSTYQYIDSRRILHTLVSEAEE